MIRSKASFSAGLIAVVTAAGLAAVLAAAPAPAPADTLRAADAGAVVEAYGAAGPGDRIELAPGRYDTVRLEGIAGTPSNPVIITSADPDDRARLSGLKMTGATHVVIEDLVLDHQSSPGQKIFINPFEIRGSDGVTLRRLLVDGDVGRDMDDPAANGYPTGFGLLVDNVRDFTLEDSEIRTFWRGFRITHSAGVRIVGNDVHSIRSDGMNFAGVWDVLVEGNRIHDFRTAPETGDHADMLQVWSSKQQTTDGLTIRGNLFNSGAGGVTQTIFMGNRAAADSPPGDVSQFYRDVTIEGNLIINAHHHGITLGHALGARVVGNTVVQNPTQIDGNPRAGIARPGIGVDPKSRDVTIKNNISEKLRLPDPLPGDWRASGNIQVQDDARMQPYHYSQLFVGGDRADPAAYAPRPGGPLDGTGIGTEVTGWLN